MGAWTCPFFCQSVFVDWEVPAARSFGMAVQQYRSRQQAAAGGGRCRTGLSSLFSRSVGSSEATGCASGASPCVLSSPRQGLCGVARGLVPIFVSPFSRTRRCPQAFGMQVCRAGECVLLPTQSTTGAPAQGVAAPPPPLSTGEGERWFCSPTAAGHARGADHPWEEHRESAETIGREVGGSLRK